MPKVHILKVKNLELIQELAYEIWPSYYSSIIGQDQTEYMLRLLYNPENLKQQQENGEVFFQVAYAQKPVGFLGLKPESNEEIKLTKLYLTEDTRGLGLGKAMLRFAEDFGKEKNYKFLILNVNRFNPTLQFYEKQGFSIRQQIDIPFGPYWLNDFIMEKKL